MKRLCTCLISMAISKDQIFETKQKSKYKVDFNFIFISIEKIFWKYIKILSGSCPWIYSKNLGYFQTVFFQLKIKLKSTLYFDFCFVSKLIWSIEIAIEIRQLYTKVS